MFIASIRLELSFPHVGSLKAKRQVLTSVMERAKHRFNVSVAEVGDQDLWQRAVIGIAVVASEAHHARAQADRVVSFVESHLEGDVCQIDVEIL